MFANSRPSRVDDKGMKSFKKIANLRKIAPFPHKIIFEIWWGFNKVTKNKLQ